ncbi:MAG: hypothetical protein MJZ69_03235 [Bacteroidaceae bacterium]|nr:hypothetical protein [Bacteroidaceae bacterium]
MKEELEDKLRNNNPFKVPEGYFDELPSKVMMMIDAQVKAKKRTIILRRWFSAAAVLVAILGIGVFSALYLNNSSSEMDNEIAESQTAQEENQYVEEMVNYAMMDRSFIDYYLTEAE